MAKPYLPNIDAMAGAGIDPKTGLPAKYAAANDCAMRDEIRKLIRIRDEQDAVNTFEWTGLPVGLSGEELERLLYYKGQLCFFYSEPLDQFFFMPYALDGTIDFYGRYNEIHPVPFTNGTTETEKAQTKALSDYLSTIKLKVLHDIKLDEVKWSDITGSAVILRDYTPQLGQTLIPRQQLQDALVGLEADVTCYLRTHLRAHSGISAMRVTDQSASSNVLAANQSLDAAALNGQRFIPVVSNLEIQELGLTDGGAATEEFLKAYQALDNMRVGFHGISSSGVYLKTEHILQSEQNMNEGRNTTVLNDRLAQRQLFCEIANSLTGLDMWCEPKQNTAAAPMMATADGGTNENNALR